MKDEALLIVADDFTGACDAAAPLAPSLVALSPSYVFAMERRVVALDLDARELSDAHAHSAVLHALASIAVERVYLKVDSTLRGPVTGLLEGAVRATRKAVAVIAPAFPEQGRTYADGRLVLDGTRGASLLELFGFERTALLAATFTRTPEEVENGVEHARMRGAVRVLVDADSPACLASIAQAWRRHPEWLLVGSGGLSRQLAPPAPRPTLPTLNSPVVVVAGSPHAATHAQLARLPSSDARLVIQQTQPTNARDEGQAAAALADAVARLLATKRPGALVLAGGATARQVCHRLDVRAVRLIGELQPGIPVGFLVGGPLNDLPVVTKAGGFGPPDALLDVVRALGVSSGSDP